MTKKERIKRLQGQALARARAAAGYPNARQAALDHRWPESSYGAHERGSRTIGHDDAERYAAAFRAKGSPYVAKDILYPEGVEEISSSNAVSLMGWIGAGGIVEPDFEQVPENGFDDVELPFPIQEGYIAFKVRGASMEPAYEEGDIVLCLRDQNTNIEGLVGHRAAIRTADGRRYIKVISQGRRRGTFTLLSVNEDAPPIENAKIAWASRIVMTIHNHEARRLVRASLRNQSVSVRKSPSV